ncbi:hypothetical protein J1N35_014518, partial [Gossypium stocksii]
MSLVSINSAQSYIISIPNPPLNKYPPMQFYKQLEYEKGEEEEEDEDDEEKGEKSAHNYDFDDILLLEQPSTRG